MTDQNSPRGAKDDTVADVSEIDSVKSDIEATRADLAATVEQVVDKLDVKKQAAQSIEGARHAAAQKVHDVKAAAPAPVQHALDTVGQKANPAAAHVNTALTANRKQILLVAGGTAAAVIVIRRVRKARS